MNWISVNDRLPELKHDDGEFKSSDVVIAFFRNESEYWCESVELKLWFEDEKPYWCFDYDGIIVTGNNITHWMPLELPK